MINIEKFRRAMLEIESRKGKFTLFALFRREYSPLGWDLVVSSRWLEDVRLKTLRGFADQLRASVGKKQLLEVSRFVTINQDDPGLQEVLSSIQVEDGVKEVRGNEFFGLQIEHAIFMRAKRVEQTGGRATNGARDRKRKTPAA